MGARISGEEDWDVVRRESQHRTDAFTDLHNDDALWAYMIRDSEQLERNDDLGIQDEVILHLLHMGIYDWKDGNNKELHQATRAIRFSTALSSRILGMVVGGERKVGFTKLGELVKFTEFLSSVTLWRPISIYSRRSIPRRYSLLPSLDVERLIRRLV